MVNIEGHRDIVRDVAWHPKRNEILTSSVSLVKLYKLISIDDSFFVS